MLYRRSIGRHSAARRLADAVPTRLRRPARRSAACREVGSAERRRRSASPRDVLVRRHLDLTGGTLVRAELPRYPIVEGRSGARACCSTPTVRHQLCAADRSREARKPTTRPLTWRMFTRPQDRYTLAPGQEELRVPLTWTDGKGVTVTKTFIFQRDSCCHRSRVPGGQRRAGCRGSAASYARIVRTDPAGRSARCSRWRAYAFARPGLLIYDGEKYRKLKHRSKTRTTRSSVRRRSRRRLDRQPAAPLRRRYRSRSATAVRLLDGREWPRVRSRRRFGPACRPSRRAAPRSSRKALFVGPKLQKQLDDHCTPSSSRVADYGVLTLLSRPLFVAARAHAHSMVKNWGLAIILVTFLLKLLFYPLSEKGRPFDGAHARARAAHEGCCRRLYKDDRTKLGQATMELYKPEKVNPLAGCLPMLIQMPVFLAFYWVLLESVEMRQAPFFGWINDLSSARSVLHPAGAQRRGDVVASTS